MSKDMDFCRSRKIYLKNLENNYFIYSFKLFSKSLWDKVQSEKEEKKEW